MLADETLCTGTTHPLCQGCQRLVSGYDNSFAWHMPPPITMTTGWCSAFRPFAAAGNDQLTGKGSVGGLKLET